MLFRLFCNPDHRIFLVLGLIAAFAAGPVGMADPVLSREEQRAGFRMLFNGRNLDGWMEIQGRAGTFWVEDGVLKGLKKGRKQLFRLDDAGRVLQDGPASESLRETFSQHDVTLSARAIITTERPDARWQILDETDSYSVRRERGVVNVYREGSAYWLGTHRPYGDFELRLEYRLPKGGNAGVFIRASHHGRTSRMGMEIQLLDDHGKKPDKGKTGSIYRVVAPSEIASKPAGEWNDLGILCHGERIRITLNGKVVTDARMEDHEELRNRFRKGYIGLSAHSPRTVEYRNVRLREILGHQATGHE